MKSMILKKIKEEFGIKKVGAKKLEQYNFYELCSIHKRLSRGEVIKQGGDNIVAKIDRTGEERLNNFGSKMNIIKYRSNRSIDVYFPEYNWIAKNRQYDAFKIGTISCPYEKRHYNIGYIGEGEYKPTINKKPSKIYTIWHDMLGRCYDEKHRHKYKTYSNITVCDEWLNFQNFAKWFDENYYEVEGEEMCLDKDILIKDNKVYSPDTCIFVPERINNLFIKSNNIRSEYRKYDYEN